MPDRQLLKDSFGWGFVLWLIGYYAIFAGILSIAFGLRLRSAGEDVETLKAELTGTKATTTESTAASH